MNIFIRAGLYIKVWRFTFFRWGNRSQGFLGISLTIFLINTTVGCSQKPGVASQPRQQFYQDVTKNYLPVRKISLQGATFIRADRMPGSDLIWFVSTPGKGSKIKILLNRGSRGIGRNREASKVQRITESIRFLAKGDISGNGVDDLVLVVPPKKKRICKSAF